MRKSLLLSLALLLSASLTFAQDRTVSGKVTSSEDGSSLPGVNIVVKGTTTGAVTDIDGNFKLTVPADGGTLVFSFIGLTTQEIEIGNRSTIDVAMASDAEQLSEVVVTAFGIEREQASLGYATAQVDGEAIQNAGNANAMDAINGRVAGVQIQNAGGQPGNGTSMIIRGYTSLNFSNQPLYVVDGIPINNDKQFGGNISGTESANRAVDINPDDIESISVLKGGQATALYGIRAGNGVVLITTKSGKKATKGLNVEYSYRYSADQVNKLHETNNDYSRGRFGTYSNVTHWSWGPHYASNPTFPGAAGSGTTMVDLNGDGTATDESGNPVPQYADNYSRFWQDGNTQRHNLNFSGGSGIGNFFGSVSTLNQEGVVPGTEYFRHSFLINGDVRVNDKIRYSGKMNYIATGGKRFRAADGILEGLGYWHHMWDVNGYPWKNPDTGDKTWFSGGVPHPQWIVNEEGEDWFLNRWIGQMGVEWDITPWITLDYRIGLDNYSERRTEVRPFGSVNTSQRLGDINDIRLQNMDFNTDLIFRGQTAINSDFDINYLVGGNMFRTDYDRRSAYGNSFILQGLYDITNTVSQTVGTSNSGKMLLGLYGNVSLGWRNTVYLEGSLRNDWSSTLPVDNNSFLYGGVSLSYVISEQLDVDWLSLLKVRGAYATTANDAPAQSLRDVYNKVDPNIFGRSRFTTSNTKNNEALLPEKTKEIEFGLDAGFLNNLITLEASYYDKSSIDQIIQRAVPAPTGYSVAFINAGEMNNKGVELTLGLNDPVKVDGFTWYTGLTFTRNVGKVVRIGEGDADPANPRQLSLASGWWTAAEQIAVEGEPYGTLYGYAWERYGDILPGEAGYLDQPLLIDANGYPTRTAGKVLLGNVNPDWILGLTSNLGYKGIRFGFTLERRQGGDVVNGFETNLVYSGMSQQHTALRHYDDNDPNANYYRVFPGNLADGTANTTGVPMDNLFTTGEYRRTTEIFVEDASWWRLRNLYVGYALPTSLIESTFLTKVEFNFTARNAWLSTPYTGNDPELSAHGAGNIQGFDELLTPNTKSFEFGVKVGF